MHCQQSIEELNRKRDLGWGLGSELGDKGFVFGQRKQYAHIFLFTKAENSYNSRKWLNKLLQKKLLQQ